MHKISRIISGFFLGLLPIIGFGIFGIAWYISFPNYFGITLCLLTFGVGLFIGIKTFQKVRIIGGIEFLSKSNSSNDMNNLKISADSTNRKFDIQEYILVFKQNNNRFKGGCVRIFGNWYGEPYSNWKEIKNMKYIKASCNLVIELNEYEKLIVHKPEIIIEDKYFLKILKAKEVKIILDEKENEEKQIINYKQIGNKVISHSTFKKLKPNFDTCITKPAVMIYGKY